MKNPNDTNLPLSEQTYFILLSLRASPKHGYAIAKDVQSLSNGRIILSVSTLYTTLKRLLDDGWIKLIDTTKDSNRPRKIYELTKIPEIECSFKASLPSVTYKVFRILCPDWQL